MSMIFCIACNKNVDTDFDLEHFTEDEECIKSQEIMVNKAEYIELKASHERLKDALKYTQRQIETERIDDYFEMSIIGIALKQAP